VVACVDSDPALKFSDEQLADAITDGTVRNGAAITLDVPLQSDQGTIGSLGGILPDLYFEQLNRVTSARLRTCGCVSAAARFALPRGRHVACVSALFPAFHTSWVPDPALGARPSIQPPRSGGLLRDARRFW